MAQINLSEKEPSLDKSPQKEMIQSSDNAPNMNLSAEELMEMVQCPADVPKLKQISEMAELPADMPKMNQSSEMAQGPADAPKTNQSSEMAQGPADAPKLKQILEMAELPTDIPKMNESSEMAELPADMPKMNQSSEIAQEPADEPKIIQCSVMAQRPADAPKMNQSSGMSQGPAGAPKKIRCLVMTRGPSNLPKMNQSSGMVQGPADAPKMNQSSKMAQGPADALKMNQSSGMAQGPKNHPPGQASSRPIIVLPGGKLEELFGNDPNAICSIKLSNEALDDARAEYLQYLKEPPNSPSVLELLSKAAKKQGNEKAAEAFLSSKPVISSVEAITPSGRKITKLLIPVEMLFAGSSDDMQNKLKELEKKRGITKKEQQKYTLLPSNVTSGHIKKESANTIIFDNSLQANMARTKEYMDVFFKNSGTVKGPEIKGEQQPNKMDGANASQPTSDSPLEPEMKKVVVTPPEKPNVE